MSETVTVWESGCYVDGWWGHYSTARALVRAITELGWEEPEAVDCAGPILTLALFDLSSMGPAPVEGSREWLEARLLEEQSRALAQSEGWSLEEDLGQILADELEQAEDWLNCQPKTPEGHYWGHSESGGWGLWAQCDGCGTEIDSDTHREELAMCVSCSHSYYSHSEEEGL